ncbi:MAG TPA: MFS transporter [Aliidongia sp.]|uniref:MFS transporter n=1 Tax=Aliidongia sp. TaxID=1914230 RepID=UPI002DDD4B4B|nr:MFS transporter [Aliidongia sp.]HEV2673582.1 MFS transporter [Aliidongia sp.]
MSSPALPTAFNRLAWSNLAAQSAEQIGLAAAPLIAVLTLGAGAGETGLLQTAQTLPFLLLSFPAGVLADRTSRRRLMAGAEALRVLSLLAILVLAWSGLLSLPLLALLGFVGATGTVAYSVTAPSLVPALVPRPQLAQANGRIELARAVAFVAGPALAGALITRVGAAPSFGAAAALSIVAVLLLAGIGEPARAAAPPRRFLQDLKEGASFVGRHPLLRPILLTAVFFNIAWFVLQAVYVPYAVHHLGLSAAGVGTTLATYGVGMVAGALLAPRITRLLPFGAVVAIGPLAGFAAALVMAATIWFPSIELAAASYFLIGVGPILWVISSTTLRQAVTPEALLGRVSAIITMATAGARPIGAAIGAAIGGGYGASACLLVAVAGFAIQALVILVSPVARLAALPERVAS